MRHRKGNKAEFVGNAIRGTLGGGMKELAILGHGDLGIGRGKYRGSPQIPEWLGIGA